MRSDYFLTTAAVSYAMGDNSLASRVVTRHAAALPNCAFAFDTAIANAGEFEASQHSLSVLAREWGDLEPASEPINGDALCNEAEENEVLLAHPTRVPVPVCVVSTKNSPLIFHDEAECEDEILLPPPPRTRVNVKVGFSGRPPFVFHDDFEEGDI